MKEIGKILVVLAKSLKTIADGVEAVAERVGELSQEQTKEKGKENRKVKRISPKTPRKAPKPAKPSPAKPSPAERAPAEPTESAGGKTAADTVLDVIRDSAEGIKSDAIMAQTGYNKKKVANILFKLGKQGKIKAVSRGVYMIG